MKTNDRAFNEKIFYVCILTLSAIFLFAGNRIASRGIIDIDSYETPYYSAVITQIIERTETIAGWNDEITNTEIIFDARITRGDRRGDIITGEQQLSDFFLVNEREVSPGDRILLFYAEWSGVYHFTNYERINYVIIAGLVFFLLVLLFGRTKGFNSIISLGFTCMSVFLVFIPAILSGRNIYATTIIICIFSIVSTLLIVVGPSKKALSAMLGCLGGVFLSGLFMILMDAIMHLTGALDRETETLLFLPTETPIDLRAIIFAGVILGAVGAIMDVSMSISSSLWEVKKATHMSDFVNIVKSGMNIGKDIFGTMLNTLILAYIGSSLSLILLITAHTTSFMNLFNMEMIVVEFLRALAGSFGMLLTIPLTATICGWLYCSPD